MLAPDFRITENLKLMGPMKAFIGYNYGTSLVLSDALPSPCRRQHVQEYGGRPLER
jgi:hypothetical protein